MKRLRALVFTVGLAGLVAILTPIWFAHHLVTRVVGTRRKGSTIDIERVDARSVALDEVMASGKPVILEGLVEAAGRERLARSAL